MVQVFWLITENDNCVIIKFFSMISRKSLMWFLYLLIAVRAVARRQFSGDSTSAPFRNASDSSSRFLGWWGFLVTSVPFKHDHLWIEKGLDEHPRKSRDVFQDQYGNINIYQAQAKPSLELLKSWHFHGRIWQWFDSICELNSFSFSAFLLIAIHALAFLENRKSSISWQLCCSREDLSFKDNPNI